MIWATIVCAMVLSNPMKAQENQDLKIPYFDSAEYVFEAERVDLIPTQDGEMAYNILKVHKVFKGNLSPGTVAILTKNDKSFGLNDRPDVFPKGFTGTVMANALDKDSKGSKPRATNQVLLQKVTKPTRGYSFNLSKLYYSLYYKENPDSATFTTYHYLSPKNKRAALSGKYFKDEGVEKLKKLIKFYNRNEYYQYIKRFLPKFEDFTDTLWQRPKTDPYAAEDTAEPIPDTMNNYYKKQREKIRKQKKELDIPIDGRSKGRQKKGNKEASHYFKNAKYTKSGNKTYLEFEVHIKSNTSGTYLAADGIYIRYNEKVFGKDVVSNNNITVTPGELINNPNYINPSAGDVKDYDNLIVIQTVPDGSYSLSATPTNQTKSIYNVKLELISTGCGKPTELEFVKDPSKSSISASVKYETNPTGSNYTEYDAYNFPNDKDHQACKPKIKSIVYPQNQSGIAAGTRQTLTIKGKFFGKDSEKNNFQSHIQMKDGSRFSSNNGPPFNYSFSHINNKFIKTWTRNKVEVELPSKIIYNDDDIPTEGKPISGHLKLTNDQLQQTTQTSQPQRINVKYAILQEIGGSLDNGVTVDQRRIKVQNKKRGLTFNISKKIANNEDAMKSIRKAVHELNCKTGMNIRLNKVVSPGSQQGENRIYYSSTKTPAMSVIYEDPLEKTSNGNYAYSNNVDIVINPNKSWYYNLTDKNQTGPGDFYQAILHELGHVAGLGHSKDNSSGSEHLMHPAATSVSPRYLTYQNSDKEGVKDMLGFSIDHKTAVKNSGEIPMKWEINQAVCKKEGKLKIRGVSLSSRCAKGDVPYFMPRVEGGQPPYFYKWQSVTGNDVTIMGNYAKRPTITGSPSPGDEVKYELEVTDIQGNTTSEVIDIGKLTLDPKSNDEPDKGGGQHDLAMRVLYDDDYEEPYEEHDVLYLTRDIWNRQEPWGMNDEGFSNNELMHQNGQHISDVGITNEDNFTVRVMNAGCDANPGSQELRLHWAHADYSQFWPNGWNGNKTFDGGKTAGQEILKSPVSLPELAPGERTFFQKTWLAPDPQDYPGGHFCMLGRVANPNDNYNLGNNTWDNVRDQNHFVIRNIKIVRIPGFGQPGLSDGVSGGEGQITDVDNRVMVTNDDFDGTVSIHVEFKEDLSTGGFENLGNVTLDLTQSMYDKWKTGGEIGNGIADVPNENSVEVTNYGSEQGAFIGNIGLGNQAPEGTSNENNFQELFVEFNIKNEDELDTGKYYFTTYMEDSQGEIIGSNDFILKTSPFSGENSVKPTNRNRNMQLETPSKDLVVYPNPASDVINVSRTSKGQMNPQWIALKDLTGKEVVSKNSFFEKEEHELEIGNLKTGLYIIEIKNEGKVTRKKIMIK